MKLNKDTKFGEKSTCCFQFGIKNLTTFEVRTRKSQNFSLLSTVSIPRAKKVHRVYLS